MRLLVTGHHGFIGSVFLPLAVAAGHEVVGLDSGLFERCTFGVPPTEPWPSIRRDLRDIAADDLGGFDAVVHLAALSNDPLGDLDPGLTYEINLEASLRLARLAKTAGVERFVFSSSCSNYGAAGSAVLDETAELKPLTPYAVSKVRLEAALVELAGDRFSPVMLRNATAFGVSPRLRLDLVLNNLVASGVARGEIVLLSDGTPWRPIVHVEDICRAMLAVLAAPREATHARAWNVVPEGENYRVRELAEIASEALGGCPVSFAAGAAPDARDYRVSGARLLAAVPGLRFRWDARRGARELVDAFRAAGLGRADFEGPRFKRLAWIQRLVAAGELGTDLRWTRSAVGSVGA